MRISGHNRRSTAAASRHAWSLRQCLFGFSILLITFMSLIVAWVGKEQQRQSAAAHRPFNDNNNNNNKKLVSLAARKQHDKLFHKEAADAANRHKVGRVGAATTTAKKSTSTAAVDPRTAACQASAFTNVETPLYIKWEEWQGGAAPLDFYIVQLGGNQGRNVKGGDPVWEYVRPCHWRGAILEPVAFAFSKLQKNYADVADRIQTLQMAVSNTTGTMSIKGMNEMARMVPLGQGRGEVPVVTLRDLWTKLQPTKVDALVVDVEGHEVACLADQDLPSPKPRFILLEIKNLNEEERQRIDDALKRQGYLHRADLFHKDKKAIENHDPPGDRLYSLPPPMVPEKLKVSEK